MQVSGKVDDMAEGASQRPDRFSYYYLTLDKIPQARYREKLAMLGDIEDPYFTLDTRCSSEQGIEWQNWPNVLYPDIYNYFIETPSEYTKQELKAWSSKFWFQQRSGRITASRLKAAVRTDIAQPSQSLIKSICYPESCQFSSKAHSGESSVASEQSPLSPSTWCFCQSEESGKMIACDNEKCKIIWFHMDCLRLKNT